MVSIIKNQLLKHLSRFTKNLSAEKINLSTFKGEGELSDLELNEIVLTELLELPTWLRLTNAWCNRVSFRIQWTQLKKVPIVLSLDEVKIIVETCEELRTNTPSAAAAPVPGKYSFIHKIIDGITINVNKVIVIFKSPAFTANIEISRILVDSKNPRWKKAELPMTRLKEPEKGQILIFKELEWQTVRIEAKSTVDKNLTPLKLLTNQARCRIVIKKRLSDCFVMGSRITIILDDLLWVLTDSQLKAALHFLDSLSGLVEKATEVTRKAKAARKLEELPEYRAQLAQQARVKDRESEISKIFAMCDVVETSYHFLSHKIVLHLSDDCGPGRSTHPNLKDGGALQICLEKFQVDYYPYHLAKLDRKHWPKYTEADIPIVLWQDQALNSFKTKFLDLLDKNITHHAPLSRANKGAKMENDVTSPGAENRRMSNAHQANVKSFAVNQFAKLMTTCVIMRIEDFTIYRVTTSKRKLMLKEFISAQTKRKDFKGDREHMQLPEDAKIIHAEFSYFYYPDDTPFPLPPPKFYVQVNPIQIYFDVDSCLWFNSFVLNLHQSLLDSKQDMPNSDLTYIDVKIEAILPRVVFESSKEYHAQRDRPKSLTFQVTRATITNVRSLEQSSRADLAKCVDSFHMGSLFFGSDFPSRPNDFNIVTQKFLDHIAAKDNIRDTPTELDANNMNNFLCQISRELLWTEAKDVWCISLDPVWGDFHGARASTKPIPFLDAVPITVWVHMNMDPNSTIKKEENRNADIHALAHISNLVSVQLNHYQYLFLLRLAEDAGELASFLSMDANRIMKVDNNGSLIFGALIPQLEATFVMPSQYPGKESSGGDVESFVPDSSSIGDDILIGGSTATVWQHSTFSMSHSIQSVGDGSRKILPNGSRNAMPEMSSSCSMNFVPQTVENKAVAKMNNQTFSNIPNNFNAGLFSMKKGFNSLMTSIDSALKTNVDDISDSISIQSDASSESEKYVIISKDSNERENFLDSMFNVMDFEANTKRSVETANEALEDDCTVTSSSNHSLTSSCRRKDIVSITTFKLNKVEFLQQSVGYSSSIKLQVCNIVNDDCNSIPWDEFQAKIKSKFSSRSRAWSENPSTSCTTTRVKLRMDHDLVLPSSKSLMEMDFSDKDNLKKIFRNFVDMQVSDLDMTMSMSSVIGLADLAEDEIIPIPLPMEINLINIQLHLNEDRPPVNITSPGPIPLDLKLSKLFICRGDDGVFQIYPNKETSVSNSFSSLSVQENDSLNQQVSKQLKLDNDELRRRLLAFERVSEENRLLRKSKEETDVLRSCLTSSQEEVSRLLDEKRNLLDEIKNLQDRLLSDKSRQWSSKR
ncbi:PREDICTED: UHRF1-binding protein 1-like isoform X2 [Nicrophorus vespilloides]|uniref:UHRF1-binding protein 1-like isoform X2 n=1 Tax=Nicrophorus vespilloides TaxID=110193 RepID=A0ABM1NJE4_NICVS|nr:PREDICTED: UHRF1-binding protein 1-like isoform X2 [Nicrophorus vespilloides]